MKSKSNSAAVNPRTRICIIGVVLAFWVAALGVRLVQLQVIRHGHYVLRAQRQQQRTQRAPARRGIIYDRNGQELAMSVMVDTVFVDPTQVSDAAATASFLGGILKVDPQDLLAKIQGGRNFAYIARRIDAETADRIRSLKAQGIPQLKGVEFLKEPKRFYPKREIAAQVLGYVGSDDNGLAGIESKFEDTLAGTPGEVTIQKDAHQNTISHVEQEPIPGSNIVLTIDEKIQYIAEKELAQAIAETSAVAGTVVVQNPHTGEILALASYPTFNPNDPNLIREIRRRELNKEPQLVTNHAISDVFEPGSMFKVVTLSSAIDEGLTNPNEMINTAPGFIVVGGHKIRDHESMGTLSVADVLAHSSNVGAIKVGMRMGSERFYKHIQDYGFGKPTGIELPGETRGLARPPVRWSSASIGAISMGQEIGVTPIQIISMISSIANDGVYTPPRIVAGTTEPTRGYQQVVFQKAEQHRVVSTVTAAEMKKMMERVVLFGTGRKATLNGYTSAGKTGTAQKVDPKTHAYSKTAYVGSFAGFAPVNNPAISVLVSLDSAKGLHQGGQVSAPVFARVMQRVLEYMQVPHDAEIKNDYSRRLMMAKVKDADIQEGTSDRLGETLDMPSEAVAVPDAGNAPPVYVARNAGPMPAHFTLPPHPAEKKPEPSKEAFGAPAREEVAHPSGTVVLDVGSGQLVPSFIGKSLRESVQIAQRSGFNLHVVGSGVARQQIPAAGSWAPAGAKIAVRFGR